MAKKIISFKDLKTSRNNFDEKSKSLEVTFS